MVIKCTAKNVIPYAEETLGYLSPIYETEPKVLKSRREGEGEKKSGRGRRKERGRGGKGD